MAKCSPFGDPNAHGSIANAVTFRRGNKQSTLMKKPNPGKGKTQRQIAHRNKFKHANEEWINSNAAMRGFLKDRGEAVGMKPRSLFIKESIKDNLPSDTPGAMIHGLLDAVIYNKLGPVVKGVKFDFRSISEINGLTFWNKCEGIVSSEIPSDIGPPGTPVKSLNFPPGKFGNAVVQAEDDAGFDVNNSFMDANGGLIMFWIKTTFDVINGMAASGNDERRIFAHFNSPYNSQIFFNDAQHSRGLRIWGPGWNTDLAGNPLVAWPADTWTWFMLGWDRSGSMGWHQKVWINDIAVVELNLVETPYDYGVAPIMFLYVPNWPGNDWGQVQLDNIKFSRQPDAWDFFVQNRNQEGYPGDESFGFIWDNENIFNDVPPYPTPPLSLIRIFNDTLNEAIIPFDYLIMVKYKDLLDNDLHAAVRLPALTLSAAETVDLYFSDDFSLYWDIDCHDLACSPILGYKDP